MDEFFAAVEKLDRPELRGKPLLIGGDPRGRGVVSTASYEARPFGCRSAMPMSQAMRLCPQAIVLPVRMERYSQISRQVFEVIERFSPLVEPLSIDEAFLDVTGSQRLLGDAVQIGRKIKQAIKDDVGLTASLGVAPNKFLAKLASDLQKPDGLVVITEETVHQVLDDLPVSRLWGVGPASEKALARLNLRTIGQIRKMPPDVLVRALGSAGEHYWRLANGMDDRPVEGGGQAKSVGQEETFVQDVADMTHLRNVLLEQVQQVAGRLRKHKLMARTVTLKIRYGDFTTITRSASFDEPTDQTEQLWRKAISIFEKWASADRRPLRLLGMTASNLCPQEGRQLSLFDDAPSQKQSKLDTAVDDINRRFGRDAIRRGRK